MISLWVFFLLLIKVYTDKDALFIFIIDSFTNISNSWYCCATPNLKYDQLLVLFFNIFQKLLILSTLNIASITKPIPVPKHEYIGSHIVITFLAFRHILACHFIVIDVRLKIVICYCTALTTLQMMNTSMHFVD